MLIPLLLTHQVPVPAQIAPIAQGPFRADLESLKQNRYPAWFVDGKLGIWSHWGPQAVPMEGDWYARNLYIPGQRQYDDHFKRYGPPSKVGHKDLIPLWRAENWDPNRLMAMYKKAGARYFVSMGVHHDNFDLWNSTYQKWNAVNMGPKRDVVGDWQRAARKQGLRFGVSEHLGASFTWFQVSHGADKTGPYAGVPYDGADKAYEDLYHWPAAADDRGWYSKDPRWHTEWYTRIKDLIDQYHPDLLYSDGGIPFGPVGEALVAHLYNDSLKNHQGKQEAVYTCKQPSDGRWVQDVERGVMSAIQPFPWQTDTSIGDWFYNRNWKYRGADWVIRTLVDVVSKNGNLLINVVQRPDGSLDPEAETVLADMAAWMKVNGESIFGTRPWIVFGEGPIRAKGGAFKEDFGFTARDVRYAAKGDGTVYATLMGKPESREVMLGAFGEAKGGEVRSVTLLGSPGKVVWTKQSDGLHLTLPDGENSSIAVVVKITGKNLRDFAPTAVVLPPAPVVAAGANREYALTADLAEIHGDGVSLETRDGQANFGYWDKPDEWVSWNVNFSAAGTYEVVASVTTESIPTRFAVEFGSQRLVAEAPATGDWGRFREIVVGRLSVTQPGKATLIVRPADPAAWHPMNLRGLRLRAI